ncbi:MAG: hypothetical protein R2792_02125 [Saprospiraceae bacterium]
MKNLLFALIAFVALGSVVGCKKDDNDMQTKNEFSYDGTTHALARGYMDNLGPNFNGTFDIDLLLASDGITFNGSAFVGTGEYVYLDLNSADTNLAAGTYNWDTTRSDFSIVAGSEIVVGYDLATLTGTRAIANGGSVTIAKDGTETSVTFNLTFADGKTVSGTFKGVLEDY